MTKGFKDSATGKVEPQNAAPPINIPVLSLDELVEKTDDFGSSTLIGEGSYGRVYYAILDNGTKMAVKKLDSTENEPTTEFLTQVGFASTCMMGILLCLFVAVNVLLVTNQTMSLTFGR